MDELWERVTAEERLMAVLLDLREYIEEDPHGENVADMLDYLEVRIRSGEREPRITPTDAVYAVEEWMLTKEQEGDTDFNPADASHSALLWRLLHGGKPLPYAPPRSYSRPDYALAENGGLVEAWVPESGEGMEGRVVINQCAEWERLSDDRVRWPPSRREYRLEKLPEKDGIATHRLTPLGSPVQQNDHSDRPEDT